VTASGTFKKGYRREKRQERGEDQIQLPRTTAQSGELRKGFPPRGEQKKQARRVERGRIPQEDFPIARQLTKPSLRQTRRDGVHGRVIERKERKGDRGRGELDDAKALGGQGRGALSLRSKNEINAGGGTQWPSVPYLAT